jgi:RND family efflux transporter MFP subunit
MKRIMNKKVLTAFVFIIIAVVGARFLLSKKVEIQNHTLANKPVISVTLGQASEGTLSAKQSYLATFSADKAVILSSKLSGYVKNVFVSEGDRVKKGELLLEIEDVDSRSNISSIESSLRALEDELAYKTLAHERNKILYEKKGLSKEQVDMSYVSLSGTKANLKEAKMKLSSAQNQLQYLHIKAPYDGIIATVHAQNGDMALAGKALLGLNSEGKKLTFSFSDKTVKKGMPVLMENEVVGSIHAVYDDAKNALQVAEVTLSKELAFKNGENITVELVSQSMQGCILDARAILYDDFKTKVVAYKENKFEFVDVSVLLEQNEKVIITPCIEEKVALSSQSKLATLPHYSTINIIETDNENNK